MGSLYSMTMVKKVMKNSTLKLKNNLKAKKDKRLIQFISTNTLCEICFVALLILCMILGFRLTIKIQI